MQEEIQVLDYNRQKIRIMQIDGRRWWALPDVGRVIGLTRYHNFTNKLSYDDKRIISVKKQRHSYGSVRLTFISESALYAFLNRSYRPEAVELQTWLESEIGVDFSAVQMIQKVQTSIKNNQSSIQASLQKAQMLIRIAEHKAIPHDEQRRLLAEAVKELTGAGIDFISSPKEEGIMNLPEVVGFIHEKQTKIIDGRLTTLIPAEKLLNDFKNPKFGVWQKVMTPKGMAREFMYIESAMKAS